MEYIIDLSHSPLVLMLLICFMSWIWEDAAVISGALLAAENKLTTPLAIFAVYLGIFSGDLALYYLGRLAHRWRKLRAWVLTNANSRNLARKFRRHTTSNIFIIRFIPGLRTIGFTLCGLWRVPLKRFLLAMSLAAAIWIGLVFSLVYQLGSSVWFADSPWKWSIMGLALCILIANNVVQKKLTLPSQSKIIKTKDKESL